MSDVLMLAGATLDLVSADALPIRCRERFGVGPSSFQVQRRAILPPTEAADTWMGQPLQRIHSGTTYFSGVIRSRSLRRGDVGWIIDYQVIGISDGMDKLPITDATSGLDVSPFNCFVERPGELPRGVGRPDRRANPDVGPDVAHQRREPDELRHRQFHRSERRRLCPAGRHDRRPGRALRSSRPSRFT